MPGINEERHEQLSLTFGVSEHRSELVDGIRVYYRPVPAAEATFRNGASERFHRWFRLTPSFGPELVRKMLNDLGCSSHDMVLDPFAGAGTTMIECQMNGIESWGFEINPFLQFVGETSLNWEVEHGLANTTLGRVIKRFSRVVNVVTLENLDRFGLHLPKIHNVFRWWRADVLQQLLSLKHSIEEETEPGALRDFFLLALAGVLVPDLTNVTLGRLQLHFIDRSGEEIDVLGTFRRHARAMIDDIESAEQSKLARTSRILLMDSSNSTDDVLPRPAKCVITSPPYPNRYSYVWNTRPHLYFFDILDDSRSAGELDLKTLGGTWGVATSVLAKGVLKPETASVEKAVGPVVRRIRDQSNLMANYVLKYFNGLWRHLQDLEKHTSPDVRLAYVVGCSRIKGVFVETDVLLAKLFEGLRYDVISVERFRRRHSGKNLHEGIVYAQKG